MAKLKVKLKRLKQETLPLRYDLKLMDNNYRVDIKKKFNELLLIEQAPNKVWSQIKENIHEAAKENIPVAKYKKNSWISNSTLDLIDLKRTAKEPGLKSTRDCKKKFGMHVGRISRSLSLYSVRESASLMHNDERRKCTQRSEK